MATGYNPFVSFDNVSFGINNDDGVDEFFSGEAAEAILEADNLDCFVVGDTTLAEIRTKDETFQNMTIGEYYRAGSSSFLAQAIGDDDLFTDGNMLGDKSEKYPVFSRKEDDAARNEIRDEEQSSQGAEEPKSLFTDSIFLGMNESIPHNPPSFLQNLDSSGLESSTGQPTKDIIFDSASVDDYRHPINIPSMSSETVDDTQKLDGSSSSSNSHHQAITTDISPADLHTSGKDNNVKSDENDSETPINSSEQGQQSSVLSSHLSMSTTDNDIISKGSTVDVLCDIPASTVAQRVNNSIGSLESTQDVFCDIIPSSMAEQPMPSFLSNTLKVDDEEWEFTLSDVNQMVEGMSSMDIDAAFSQIMAQKKEKVKQLKIADKQNNQQQVIDLDPSSSEYGYQTKFIKSTGESESNHEYQHRGRVFPDSEKHGGHPPASSGYDSQTATLQLQSSSAANVPSSCSVSDSEAFPKYTSQAVFASQSTGVSNTCKFSDSEVHSAMITTSSSNPPVSPGSSLDNSIGKLMQSIRPSRDSQFGGCNNDVSVGDTSSFVGADDSAMGVTLLVDNNNETAINDRTAVMNFAASTPMFNHRPNNATRDLQALRQSAILHLVTPHRIQEVLDLPTRVDVPEVCCVLLSQQVHFPIRNKLRSGIQCSFSITKMVFNGKVVDASVVCPFAFNRRITLSANSHEAVQVLFAPNCAGDFFASMEVTAQSLTNSEEVRTYEVNLTGRAEFPKLKVLPNSEEIDFGDLIWGSSHFKTIKVQNVGQATVPVRFTVIRTNSPLCTFSFQSSDVTNNNPDISRTSVASIPSTPNHSVISVPLLGVREGEQPTTQSIKVYCHIKGVNTATGKYSQACEVFEGILSMELDSLIPSKRHLTQFRLRVRAGMIKLHLNKSALILSSPPGQSQEGTVKVVNSGNIAMKVALDLEPSTDLFHVIPKQMIVDPQSYQLAKVSFTPQDHNSVDTQLVLLDQMNVNYLPIRGQTKQLIVTKINANASSISFGGAPTGHKSSKAFKFSLDQDVKVKCFIKQGMASSFQIALDDGTVKEEVELWMTKGVRTSVHIVFIPEEITWFSSTLVLQVLHGDSFSIPLSGYGGVSKIIFAGLTETKSGDTVIPIEEKHNNYNGEGGSPFTHSFTITNTGVRSAFVHSLLQDKSHNVISPHQITVMPSELLLAPQESREMMVWMLHPAEGEKSTSRRGLSLKGIVKLTYGDEINRQLLRRNPNSDCQRLALNYSLELSQDQKTRVAAEMQDVPGEASISVNGFKSFVKSKKIGLFTGLDELIMGQPRSSAVSIDNRSAPSSGSSHFLGASRPVLQTVSMNGQQQLHHHHLQQQQQQQQQHPTKMDKMEWSVSPLSVTFKVLDARSKEFAQIINYSDKELRFCVEPDDCLSMSPIKGVIDAKSWCQLDILTSGKFWSSRKKPSCALIKVKCNDETKHIRVLVEGATVSKMTFPPMFPTQGTTVSTETSDNTGPPSIRSTQLSLGADECRGSSSSSSSSSEVVKSQRLASSCHQQRQRQDFSVPEVDGGRDNDNNDGIFGPGMVIIPSVSLGGRAEVTYVFTNVSEEALTWKSLAVGPMSLEPMPNHPSGSKESSAFCPHPQSGFLEPGGVQTISLAFTPLTIGSYKQIWAIQYYGVTRSNLHKFTIYAKAKAKESQAGTQEVPICLSPKRQQRNDQATQPHSTQSHQQSSPPQRQQLPGHSHNKQNIKDNLPKWTSCQPQPVSVLSSTDSGASGADKKATATHMAVGAPAEKSERLNEAGGNKVSSSSSSTSGGCLQLEDKVLRFSTVHKGEGETLFLKLSNTSPRDAEVTVEQQPSPPFIIRHTHFTVRKGRMIKVPVTYKPLHVAKFKQQVVVRDKHTNTTFTAVLEAECVP